MNRAQTILLTTVILSIALTSVFGVDFSDISLEANSTDYLPFFYAQAGPDLEPIHHTIEMQAVKMPDGMYAYQMLSYETSDGRDLVDEGIYTTKPTIPGPTLVFTENDIVDLKLYNNACDDFVIGEAGPNENSLVGVHVHGVHYDIKDDATYARVNMNENSAAECDGFVDYFWSIEKGTEGTWPYHDHTFKQNEVGAEDVGLFGAVIVNPYDGKLSGLVKSNGKVGKTTVEKVDKEFVLWMVSSEVLGRSVFYGMEIDNKHPETPGKQTPLWVNPPLYTEEGKIVRYHVLGLGDETHAFHLHGHRWVDDSFNRNELIDVKEITPLQRHSFLIQASSNNGADETPGTEAWMYHCHVFDHMEAGMSGMMMVVDDDTLPDVGAVFTLSDEPGLWMKTLDAGIIDVLDEILANDVGLPVDTNAGIGFPPKYLGQALSPEFVDTEGRSTAVINPGETVLFNMKDSQTKHTITALIYPTDAQPNPGNVGGNGLLSQLDLGFFDTQLGIRGSSFITDGSGEPLELDDPGLYVFVCKIHPYMFGAVIVDDPTTNVLANELGAPLPLLDLSDDLTVMVRTGPLTDSDFPTKIPPTDPLASELLKDFYVITDPSNWKDYIQTSHKVNVPPVLVTTNTEDIVVGLHADEAGVLALVTLLNITKTNGEPPGILVTGLGLDSDLPIGAIPTAEPGVGEVWVDTQFERTVNKNHEGTPQDKPGTITVVDASNWTIKKKVSLPEINMNHPHNMWTDDRNEVIYQTQWFDSRMTVIDRDSGEMITDTFVGQSPSHVMTAPDTGKIYVAMNGEEQVTELDPVTYETTRQISTGPRSHPHGHWISSDGKYMVTPDFLGLKASVIDLTTGTVSSTGTGSLLGPIATGMTSNGETFYTADFLGNTLSVIDTDTQIVTKQIDLGANHTGLPIQTPVSPDDKWVVTANVIASKITVVDTSSNEVVAVLPCDPGCHGVQWGAKNGGGYYAYVSSKFSNALLIVDPLSGHDAAVVGKVVLNKESGTTIDDPVIGYAGMGGQGVLAIPNVYPGWIQNTVTECGSGGCGDVSTYIGFLKTSQKNP
jgi:FtsP/CotA-like multicopper oxidase with cupredoxin domain/plastocyanin